MCNGLQCACAMAYNQHCSPVRSGKNIVTTFSYHLCKLTSKYAHNTHTNMHTMSPDVSLKQLTANTTRFSGVEIAGLVRAAASYALDRMVSCYCSILTIHGVVVM